MLAHLQRILCVSQAQREEEPNGQQQRMKIPHHHGMVAQLQMIARYVALKARDALPVQFLCVSIKVLPVVLVEKADVKANAQSRKTSFSQSKRSP